MTVKRTRSSKHPKAQDFMWEFEISNRVDEKIIRYTRYIIWEEKWEAAIKTSHI